SQRCLSSGPNETTDRISLLSSTLSKIKALISKAPPCFEAVCSAAVRAGYMDAGMACQTLFGSFLTSPSFAISGSSPRHRVAMLKRIMALVFGAESFAGAAFSD
ncbi:hypothetical protein, partial [Iodidimonas sp. MBR-55]|uniref:hypothetical protein n=1 Tax=Iodidimonas sp. MBR-55 TaxID=3032321 RepID=UPI002482D8F3